MFDKNKFDIVLNFAAESHVDRSILDAFAFIRTNVYGAYVLFESARAHQIPRFIYISTEFAEYPYCVYALTKKLGEEIVKTHPAYLILRTLFKPNPFPFSKAYIDQYTQGDYVDVVAKLLAEKVKSWDRKTSALEYLGTGRKTIFELAKKTRPDVEPNSVDEFIKQTGVSIPKDYE